MARDSDATESPQTQLLAELVEQGRLKASNKTDAKVTYHDPCYLGRYNDIYDEPRKLVASVTGAKITEMDQHRERSFCCGAGGGLMWAEEPSDQRIHETRAGHALKTGASIVSAACPFCMTMMEDGIKAHGAREEVKVLDIVELLEGSG